MNFFQRPAVTVAYPKVKKGSVQKCVAHLNLSSDNQLVT